jgi:hypothetical protein
MSKRGAVCTPRAWQQNERQGVQEGHDDEQGPVPDQEGGVLKDPADHGAQQVGTEGPGAALDVLEALGELPSNTKLEK